MKHVRLCGGGGGGGAGGCFFSDLKMLEDGETFISIVVLVLNLENRIDFSFLAKSSFRGGGKEEGWNQAALSFKAKLKMYGSSSRPLYLPNKS